jgi:hypothetical protein
VFIGGLLAASFAFAGNAVLEWNRQAIDATRLSRTPPPPASMFLATMHVAIFDAVNGMTRTHQGWLVNEPAPAGIDRDAAIAGAAHKVLAKYWGPGVSPRFVQLAYEQALAKIPNSPAKTAGIAWGEHVADLILAKRADCGFDKPMPGPFSSNEAGKWRETPPGFRPATLPHWCAVTPFMMTSCSQFRAPPPPALDSQAFADDYAYVYKVGARDGADRTEYQTLASAFWSDDLGTCTPPGHWNVIAQDLAERYKLSVEDTARLFALLNMTEADAAISCWDTKFFYRTWRPETALREMDAKLNPHMAVHADFIPNMQSPSFPSYTSGHSTFSAAASRLLERFFGTDDIKITAQSDGLPGAVRTFNKLSEARDEIGMSRVWAGIHTMSDNIAGQQAGLKIADWVFTNGLPTRKSGLAAAQ